jgi:hypothetical protein
VQREPVFDIRHPAVSRSTVARSQQRGTGPRQARRGSGCCRYSTAFRQQGLSILLVEQNAALAIELVDYVHVLEKGRVVYSASPQQLWDDEAAKSRYLGI